LQDEKDRRGAAEPSAILPDNYYSDPLSANYSIETEEMAQQQDEEPLLRPAAVAGDSAHEKRAGCGAMAAMPAELEVASFRLLLSQGLINNGRQVVQYRGPFQCLGDGCQEAAVVIPNNKLVVRHWNSVHG